MDASEPLRKDVPSPYISITNYQGSTLIGPKELITRKVYSSQSITAASPFTQLNFRVLATSPMALLNARCYLTVPLRFSNARVVAGNAASNAAGVNIANGNFTVDCNVAPRRNALLKAMQSVTTTVNSTVSFSTRSSEALAVAEQLFMPQEAFTFVGTEIAEESGTWGPTEGGSVGPDAAAAAAAVNGIVYPRGSLMSLRKRYNSMRAARKTSSRGDNRGFVQRAAEFRSGSNAGGTQVDVDMRTALWVPPFKCFTKDQYSRSPTWLPHCDNIDLLISWKRGNALKSALLMGAQKGDSGAGAQATLVDYEVAYRGVPYLTVEWCVPDFAIPPAISLPCWRTVHYSKDIAFAGNAAGATQQVTFQGIRVETLPSLITCHITRTEADMVLGNDGTGTPAAAGAANPNAHASDLAGGLQYEFFNPITAFSITLNERLKICSDKDAYELWKLYRMYAPQSKIDFYTWQNLRCIVAIRSDVLAVENGQSVFAPTSLSIDLTAAKNIQRSLDADASNATVHLNFWYFNEALSLSTQSAAVTSLLLNPSQVRVARVSAEAQEIADIASYAKG